MGVLSFYNPLPAALTQYQKPNTHGPGSTEGDDCPTPGGTELGPWGHNFESAQRSGQNRGWGVSKLGMNRLQEGRERPWVNPEAELGLAWGLAWHGSG